MIAETRKCALASGLFFFAFLSDQGSKALFQSAASVRMICNDAGPWGVPFANGTVLIGALISLLAVLLLCRKACIGPVPLALLLGGGLSNLADRLWLGCVRDFTVVSWFPALNLADAFLTLAAGLVVWELLLHWKRPAAVAQ